MIACITWLSVGAAIVSCVATSVTVSAALHKRRQRIAGEALSNREVIEAEVRKK